MTNEQTALAKLREDMIRHRDSLKAIGDYPQVMASITVLDSYIDSIIPMTFPYEREQMEKMFSMGKLCGEHLYSATDYFNQNYTQDGK